MTAAPKTTVWQRSRESWNRFWFTPSDPTLMGLIRICTGVLTVYTFFAFSFDLQSFYGERAWLSLEARRKIIDETPVVATPLRGEYAPLTYPKNEQESRYLHEYRQEFRVNPPNPYPRNDAEKEYIHAFGRKYNFDLRRYGLPPPRTEAEKEYLEWFAAKYRDAPAPPYPKDEAEKQQIEDYMSKHGVDPHRLIAKGRHVWSFWFHITHPTEMIITHSIVLIVACMFMFGFCTRLTSALTCFAFLSYIHRDPLVLFGADTMMNILLIYLTIAPSGAALSLDRVLSRWWSKNKVRVVNRWRGLFGRDALTAQQIRPAHYDATPGLMVSATVARRLLQVHLCIIYFMAGTSKLLGQSWWNGQAVWGTIANFEFAPMHFEFYNEALRFLGHNRFVFNTFLFTGTFFTLAFEIGYAFLIWRPSLRWVMLGMAIVLHGFIGTLMGLKTFSLIMVVMNMAFLTDDEAHRIVRAFQRMGSWFTGPPQPADTTKSLADPVSPS